MARNFDGTDDNIDFGADTSINSFTQKTIMLWVYLRTPATNYDGLVSKQGANDLGWQFVYNTFNNPDAIAIYQHFDGSSSHWYADTAGDGSPINQWIHIAVTYDNSSTSNDAVIYENGVSQSITEDPGAPSGTASGDSDHALRMGETSNGTIDADYIGCCLVYHNEILDAAAVNRARWWGRPHGGMKVYHPLFTDKLSNEGTATANGTATGSTMTSMPKVQRPGSGMMGMIGI